MKAVRAHHMGLGHACNAFTLLALSPTPWGPTGKAGAVPSSLLVCVSMAKLCLPSQNPGGSLLPKLDVIGTW